MRQSRLESEFQARLISKIRTMFPGCYILKNDSGYIQGIPDLTILFGSKWAMLEVKESRNARHQPNQEHYISDLNDHSYAAFVYPENEEDILYDLQQTFSSGWSTRIS